MSFAATSSNMQVASGYRQSPAPCSAAFEASPERASDAGPAGARGWRPQRVTTKSTETCGQAARRHGRAI